MALSQLEKFDTTISLLATNPYLGVIPKDERLKKLGYRMLVIDKYLCFMLSKLRPKQFKSVVLFMELVNIVFSSNIGEDLLDRLNQPRLMLQVF